MKYAVCLLPLLISQLGFAFSFENSVKCRIENAVHSYGISEEEVRTAVLGEVKLKYSGFNHSENMVELKGEFSNPPQKDEEIYFTLFSTAGDGGANAGKVMVTVKSSRPDPTGRERYINTELYSGQIGNTWSKNIQFDARFAHLGPLDDAHISCRSIGAGAAGKQGGSISGDPEGKDHEGTGTR